MVEIKANSLYKCEATAIAIDPVSEKQRILVTQQGIS